jgi:hypothetical protein
MRMTLCSTRRHHKLENTCCVSIAKNTWTTVVLPMCLQRVIFIKGSRLSENYKKKRSDQGGCRSLPTIWKDTTVDQTHKKRRTPAIA